MIKYAKLVNENTKLVNVGLGTDENFYKSIGMKKMDVEQAYNGEWYLKGYCPSSPAGYDLQFQLTKKEAKYGMSRLIREGILGNPTAYSQFNVNRAKELEELAKQIRDLKEGK